MATQKENKFITININDDFKQYAWVLESYDIKAAFKDFLRIEQGIQTEGNEDILNELYKQFLESKSSDHMTQLQFDVLNYILKYESGVYKKGEIIADIVEESDGNFTINEPGYYYIEVTGNAGNSSGIYNNYLKDVSLEVTTLTGTGVTLYVRDDLKFNLIINNGKDDKRIGGYIELNKKYAFFYSAKAINGPLDKSKNYGDYKTGFSDISEVNPEDFTLYDYAVFEDDIFNENFFNITFVENGLSVRRDIKINYNTYTCGVSDDEVKASMSKIDEEKCSYYSNIIKENLTQKNCKVLGYSSVIEKEAPSRNGILHQNELHGGDGGFINSVIKIKEPLTLQYTISPKNSGKKNSLKCDFFEIIAEAGGSLTSNSSKYKFDDVDEYNELGLYDSIDNHKFSNQTDLTAKFDSHIGESINHDVLCGCGRGIYKDSNGVVQHVFYGGGALGEGVRLNEFGTAYYQEKDIGHIRIKYLGSQYCKTQVFNYDSEHKEDISLYTNEKIPVSDDIDIKLNLRKLYGCFDKNGIEDIIKPVSRSLNYINAKLITKNVTDKTYIFKHNDNQYVSFEPLTEEYSYVNDENTNECNFNSPLFGTGKSITLSTIMKNNSECFDMKFIYAYNFVINPKLYMEIESFKNSKLILNFSDIETNVKIFRKYSEVLSISFLLKNTLQLPKIIDSFGDITHEEDPNARVESIEYKTDYGDEKNFLTYNEGQIIYVSKGTTFYLKFNFSSPRIAIDGQASSFSGKVSYIKKNLELDGRNVLDHYFNPDKKDNFQYVIFSPSFSQDVSIFIKKYTYTFKLVQDLYRNLVINNVSLKNDFEVGECCEISFNLKNYERLSHLKAEKDNIRYMSASSNTGNKQYVPSYAYVDEKNEYESFLVFYDKDELNCTSYNFCDIRINNMLNREGCFGKNVGKMQEGQDWGLFAIGSRDINEKYYTKGFESSVGPQVKFMAINKSKNLSDELITFRIYFKESNIKLRLSSDYCNGEEIFTYENGESSIVSFFKPYAFVVEISGGPTGAGENASTEKEKGYRAAKMGFFGGDGYSGGNGGASGDTAYWSPSKSGWHFAITDLHLDCSWGIEEAYGGRGFIKSGAIGSEGKNTLTHNQQCLFKTNNNTTPWTDKCNWYAGIPIVRELRIFKTIEDFKPIIFYFKAGVQGLNLVNSSGDGRGGGAGLPSFLTAISNNSYFTIKRDFNKGRENDISFPRFYDYGVKCYTTSNEFKTGLIVEGGIAGVTRGCENQENEYTKHVWSLSDMFNIVKYDEENQYKYYKPYKWVNGHKSFSTSYEDLYAINNVDEKVGLDRLLNNKMGDDKKPLFSSTGYFKGIDAKNLSFQQKFKDTMSYDKNYLRLINKKEDNIYEFKDTVIPYTNTGDQFSNTVNDHNRENDVSSRYLSHDYFIGKAFYSYESGVIKVTAHNSLAISSETNENNSVKVSYEKFIEGENETYFLYPYFSTYFSEEELLTQIKNEKIKAKVDELISAINEAFNKAIIGGHVDAQAANLLKIIENKKKNDPEKWYIEYYNDNSSVFSTYGIEYKLDNTNA